MRQMYDNSVPCAPRPSRSHGVWVASLAAAFAGACGSPESGFIRSRSFNPCIQAVPACPGLAAECTLDTHSYTEVNFPHDAPLRFLVIADAGTEIDVRFFLKEQRDVGSDTRIYWNEPGCTDVHVYKSLGQDLFAEAGSAGILSRAQVVDDSGDHLIEILTDMHATVLVAIGLNR